MWQPCGCAAQSRMGGSMVQSPKNSGGLSWLPRSPQKPKSKIPSQFLDLPHSWSSPVAVQPEVRWVALWCSHPAAHLVAVLPENSDGLSWLPRSPQKPKSKFPGQFLDLPHSWSNPVAVQPEVGWVALWSSQQPLTWWLCCPKVA